MLDKWYIFRNFCQLGPLNTRSVARLTSNWTTRGYTATSQLVTRSCRHTVNWSQTRLITQSTRHKRAHNKTTSTSHNYLHAVSLRKHPERVLNMDGVITAICVTLMYTADSRSRRQITLLRKVRSTRHNAAWNTTVNSSHDFRMWRVDHVTSW